jgi:hypothetical protein
MSLAGITVKVEVALDEKRAKAKKDKSKAKRGQISPTAKRALDELIGKPEAEKKSYSFDPNRAAEFDQHLAEVHAKRFPPVPAKKPVVKPYGWEIAAKRPDDVPLALAVLKAFEADVWYQVGSSTLARMLAKHFKGLSPVMVLGRAAELGYLVSHQGAYARPSACWLPVNRKPAPKSQYLINADHIEQARGRLAKIEAKFAAEAKAADEKIKQKRKDLETAGVTSIAASVQKDLDAWEKISNTVAPSPIRVSVPSPENPVQIVVFARCGYYWQFQKLEK